MKRIKLYYVDYSGGKLKEFGNNYIHWLVEDRKNCFWVLSSGDSRVDRHEKPKYSWEQEDE